MNTRSQTPAVNEDRRRPPRSSTSPAVGRASDSTTRNAQSTSTPDVNVMRPRKSAEDSSPPPATATATAQSLHSLAMPLPGTMTPPSQQRRRARSTSPWGSCSLLTLTVTLFAFALTALIIQSFLARQLDPKGCAMSYMRPAFAKFSDFDTEHTRFASKYSLYLYREGGIDEDTRVKGVPVLFIPGNAGSYKQVRPLAAEAATYFHEFLSMDPNAAAAGQRPLDFFSVDFNEDITAFHGQTLMDQAEFLNEAIAYILALYHNPHRSLRDPELPDPTSVILVGHSMGGVVARTMLTIPNYRPNSINTILTLAAPHARAPVSFDADIVHIYDRVNTYWRTSYSQQRAEDNPLAQLTLVSIAGGGLDTIVPSDYSTIASLVPLSHGFTVFTSTIPGVWTSMDHLAITWCDQLRKSVTRALYEVIDANGSNQTRPWRERVKVFKRHFLTGMEDTADRGLQERAAETLLTLDDSSGSFLPQGHRLSIRSLGGNRKPTAHVIPMPPQTLAERKRFTLITDQSLDEAGGHGSLEVLFCRTLAVQTGQATPSFPVRIDLSGGDTGLTHLACKNAASDVVLLPASTSSSTHPFDNAQPFSYLQYSAEDFGEHQYVAVLDKTAQPTYGWVVAEFASDSESTVQIDASSTDLLFSGLDISLSPKRPLMTEIKIPLIHSSLLAYKLSINRQPCSTEQELFMPLVRQHIADPYESKFYVNVREAEISLHGVAPYMPPSLPGRRSARGLSLQIWADPTCSNIADISMHVDIVGSLGKLWMRYRTVFAAFPLIVVALVLRKQFKLYDETGVFISFTESMDQCLRSSVPVLLAGLTMLAMSFSRASEALAAANISSSTAALDSASRGVDYTQNDLLLGSQDSFFWFLIPMFGVVSIGVSIVLNYTVLVFTHTCALTYSGILSLSSKRVEGTRFANTFTATSYRQRIITTGVLLLLVSTVIPYQFVYIVLCVVQIATCVRALNLARETVSHSARKRDKGAGANATQKASSSVNFYNYAHSILLLMLWILPINIPVLVVWMHNLAVHWLTPFSSHHNVLAIMPFVMLVETLSTGNMVPRMTLWFRQLTALLLFGLAVYAAVYGVTFAYRLHWIANVLCVWLVGAHLWGYYFGGGLGQTVHSATRGSVGPAQGEQQQDTKKRP